jgi:hypothetical protein
LNKKGQQTPQLIMVSSENKTALYLIIPLYFTLLVVASCWAYRRTKRIKQEKKT